MSNRAIAVPDSTSEEEITYPPILCELPEDVAEVRALEGFRLYVRFFDGTEGTVFMEEMLRSKEFGVFCQLLDPAKFADVGIEYGAVTWATGQDLAPDAMYTEFKQNGEWVLR